MDQGTSEEQQIIDELSVLIEQGRETTVEAERAEIYEDALDKVMELAVELPTYQRVTLYTFNSELLNPNTLNVGNGLSAFAGPLVRIWEISFNQ
jgi:peptide/nickel transport system substrate-binding protein